MLVLLRFLAESGPGLVLHPGVVQAGCFNGLVSIATITDTNLGNVVICEFLPFDLTQEFSLLCAAPKSFLSSIFKVAASGLTQKCKTLRFKETLLPCDFQSLKNVKLLLVCHKTTNVNISKKGKI